MGVICPYCNKPTELVNGEVIYPHRSDLKQKLFWYCAKDDAFVGCHPGTEKPLGYPATAFLRSQRSSIHALLDPLWRSGAESRSAVYAKLAKRLGIDEKLCHVAMFDSDRCEAARQILLTWDAD